MFMIKYFSIDQTPVVEFDEWVGVLNLATKWPFQEVSLLLHLQKFLSLKSWPRSEQEPFPNFQVLLNRRQSWKELL